MRLSIVPMLVVTVISAGAASADTPYPHRKAGLWEGVSTMAGAGTANFSTQNCVDAASEAKMSAFSSNLRQKKCSAASITHNMDGSWTSTSTCEFSGKTIHTRAVITGDFNSKYTVAIYREGETAPQMTMTMTYKGACAPGMKGGDVIMSNGMKMNLLDNSVSGVPH